MHKNKGHGTRSRLQGIGVHQQISRTQVGLLCMCRCRVNELLEAAKGSIKALLQPTTSTTSFVPRKRPLSAPCFQTTAPTLALLMFTRPSGSVASNQRLSTPMEKWLWLPWISWVESESPLSIMVWSAAHPGRWHGTAIYIKGQRSAVSLMQTRDANWIVDLPRFGF